MPQEFDAITGNFVTQEDSRADPLAPGLYRSAVAAADGAAKPAPNDARWAVNPGYRARARVFVATTGSPAAATLRPYLRSGGQSGQVGTATAQPLNGTPNYDAFFDIQADGDDLLVLVESISGGSNPTVTIYLSWR